jgi:hypothetical protein
MSEKRRLTLDERAVEALESIAGSLQRIDRELLALASDETIVHGDSARRMVLGLYATLDKESAL